MGRYITVKQLLKVGACSVQIHRFVNRFGSRVYITEKRAAEHAGDFAWQWAASNLLSMCSCRKWIRAAYRANSERYEALKRIPATGLSYDTRRAAEERITLLRAKRRAVAFAKLYLADKPKKGAK